MLLHRQACQNVLIVHLILICFLANVTNLDAAERAANLQEPSQVIVAYLRAFHARDFVEAYRYISSADRKVRDLDRYVRQRGAFNGFILDAARKLSESVEITNLQHKVSADRIQAIVRYRVPDSQSVAPILLNWDPYRLNSLSTAERKQILEALEKKQNARALEMHEIEESIELVKEMNEWRLFLNWAAGVRIPLRLDLSKIRELEVTLSQQEVVLQPGEVFEIFLKIKNKTNQAITTRIGHLVDPNRNADFLDFVQCGFLLPVTIPPGTEQKYYGSYLLRGSLPESVRQLTLTYDFRVLQ